MRLRILAEKHGVPEIGWLGSLHALRDNVSAACGVKRSFAFMYYRESTNPLTRVKTMLDRRQYPTPQGPPQEAFCSITTRWHGLRLQVVARRDRADDLAPVPCGPFVERELGVRIEVAADALRQVAGPVLRRKDGKPLVNGIHVCASHNGGTRLAVTRENPVGCDVQVVDCHGQWDDLLGHATGGQRSALLGVGRPTTAGDRI